MLISSDKKNITKSIEEIINAAVIKAIEVGRVQRDEAIKDSIKATEKRLYALPILILKVENDKSWIEEVLEHGAPGRSGSIIRFKGSGVRLTPEEIADALVLDKRAEIAADEHEIAVIQKALTLVREDEYYNVIKMKYLDRRSDEEIAENISCDPRTVRRNKNRLIQQIAVFLYGSVAVA